jgi:CRISPR-associated protein Cas2
MVVVVTRNVPDRYRGFLASCMLEIAPGVYTGPGMSTGVRERVWGVLEEWWASLSDEASIVMTWQQDSAPGGQGLRQLGLPAHEFIEHEGVVLIRRALPGEGRTEVELADGKGGAADAGSPQAPSNEG